MTKRVPTGSIIVTKRETAKAGQIARDLVQIVSRVQESGDWRLSEDELDAVHKAAQQLQGLSVPLRDRGVDLAELRKEYSYDPNTGKFMRLSSTNKQAHLGDVSRVHDGYFVVRLAGGKHRMLHRVIWYFVHGEWPKGHVDHVNGDPLDNRLSNLREATHQQNTWNTRVRRDSRTGFKGVTKSRDGKFRANIKVHGKTHFLGTYERAVDAAEAYRAKAQELQGEFARSS